MSNERPDIQIVTSETLHEFLGITPPATPEEPASEIKEPVESEETPEVEETPEETPEPEVKEEPEAEKRKPGRPKRGLEERMRELTSEVKSARAAAEEARAEAARERKAREELEAKNQPPAKDPNAKPDPNDFKDAFEYADALAQWSAEQALAKRDREAAENAEKERRQSVVNRWNENLAEARREFEDFDEVLASADAQVSDAIRDAIIESDVGPRILHYLASNPEVVEKINGLSERNALKEIGKLEARLEKSKEDKAVKPEVKPRPEVSKAPAPIRPIRSQATPDNLVDAEGNFHGTPAEYRKLREAGKI